MRAFWHLEMEPDHSMCITKKEEMAGGSRIRSCQRRCHALKVRVSASPCVSGCTKSRVSKALMGRADFEP